jgi:hypothetical protein
MKVCPEELFTVDVIDMRFHVLDSNWLMDSFTSQPFYHGEKNCVDPETILAPPRKENYISYCFQHNMAKKLIPWPLDRKRTIPTECPKLVGEL